MSGSIATVNAGETLVHVPNPAHLPLALEMIHPHDAAPRCLVGGHVYLLAPNEQLARIYRLAVAAAVAYEHVDLASETNLRLPVAEAIAHRAKIRIAKVRAARLYAAMRATFRRAEEREERHGRLMATGEELGNRALATWQNASLDTVTGWGDAQAFRSDPEYLGDIVCTTPAEDGAPPRWLRLPTDERILLDHGLDDRDREVASTVQEARADTLGIAEPPREPRP